MSGGRAIAFVLASVLAAACASAGDAPETPTAGAIPVRTLARGGDCQGSEAREVVIRDGGTWRAFWEKTFVQPEAKTAPFGEDVDFEKEWIVAVFAGEKPTAGYSIAVTAVERAGDDLVVTYAEKRPAPGAIAAQVITHPYHVVRVPRVAGQVKFKDATAGR